jgi:hypothetical protein
MISEREPDEAQRHHCPGRGLGDGASLMLAFDWAMSMKPFTPRTSRSTAMALTMIPSPKPPSTSWICSLRVIFTPSSSKITSFGDGSGGMLIDDPNIVRLTPLVWAAAASGRV